MSLVVVVASSVAGVTLTVYLAAHALGVYQRAQAANRALQTNTAFAVLQEASSQAAAAAVLESAHCVHGVVRTNPAVPESVHCIHGVVGANPAVPDSVHCVHGVVGSNPAVPESVHCVHGFVGLKPAEPLADNALWTKYDV